MNRKAFWVLFAAAAVMRLWSIGSAPLWYDENFTLLLARLPLDRMIAATAGDVHPPLWYLIEWLIFRIPGLPVWCIRIPAAVFSTLALFMLWRVMTALRLDPMIQTGALVLMAVMPMQLWYAQEGRMYALLEFLVLAALLAALELRWIPLLLASVAMLYTQNYAMFYLPVIYAVAFLFWWSGLNWYFKWWDFIAYLGYKFVLVGVLSILSYIPWLKVIAGQMDDIAGRYWIMNISGGAVLEALYRQFFSSAIWYQMVMAAYVAIFAGLVLGTMALLRRRTVALVIIPMAFGPLLLSWLASYLVQPVLLFRPLIGISPFLYIVIAALLPQLRQAARPLQLATAALAILPLSLGGISGYYANIADIKGEGAVSPMMDALDYVRENWQPGDVLYYADDGPMINLMPYTSGMPQYRMPACAERIGYAPILGSLSDRTRLALGAQIADLDDVPHTRAWVFAPRSPLHPLCYEEQIAPLTAGDPVIVVDDNQYLSSAIWLLE